MKITPGEGIGIPAQPYNMSALEQAREQMEYGDNENISDDSALVFTARAQAYAAIANAEQLKRIADVMERWIGPATVDPLEDYHRNALPGESIAEYEQRIASIPVDDRY